jgi:enamine deaminase RidA (YjgF/YER057c/UK114 family)
MKRHRSQSVGIVKGVFPGSARRYDRPSVPHNRTAIMPRDFDAFRLPMLIVGATAMMAACAQAQSHVRYINPPAIAKPPGYTHVVEVSGPVRTVYIAGQLGYDGSGKQGGDFRAQATLVYENLKAAVESVGGKMENIVKLNAFLTDIRAQLPIYREVRDKYVNVAAPPASTTLEISKLAREGALLEVEAVAVLPAR